MKRKKIVIQNWKECPNVESKKGVEYTTSEKKVEEQIKSLKSYGFKPPFRPEGKPPVLPADITTMSPIELGKTQGQFVSWMQYANWMLSVIEAEIKSVTFKLKLLCKEDAEEILEDSDWYDPEIPESAYEAQLTELKIRKDLMGEIRNNFKAGKESLSREQSRKKDLEPPPR